MTRISAAWVLRQHELEKSLVPQERLLAEGRRNVTQLVADRAKGYVSVEEAPNESPLPAGVELRAYLDVLTPEQARALTGALRAYERYPAGMLEPVMATLYREVTGNAPVRPSERPSRLGAPPHHLPQKDELYRHFKDPPPGEQGQSNPYVILTTSRDSETRKLNVVFCRVSEMDRGVPWSRSVEIFIDEVQDDAGEWVPRFVKLPYRLSS